MRKTELIVIMRIFIFLLCSTAFSFSTENPIKVKEKQIIAVENKILAVPQGVTLTGKVTEASGMALPGANIIEKGTSNGAQFSFESSKVLF